MRVLARHRGRKASGPNKWTRRRPGEKRSLCGQVMPAPADEVVASALAAIDLCTKAGMPHAAAALVQVKLSGAEMKVLSQLDAPDLRSAILRRTTAAMWNEVIAEQKKGRGKLSE
jgi:hypothetical protein